MLGLERGKLRLEYSHQEWVQFFEKMRDQLRAALGENALTIEHIGSTSIPGMLAKPIVDICIGIPSYETGIGLVPIMESVGFEYFGNYGLAGRHYFMNQGSVKYCHVHMLCVDSSDYTEHILFRDYLKGNPIEAQRYSAFKEKLVEERIPRWEYVQRKDPFIKLLISRAKQRESFPSDGES